MLSSSIRLSSITETYSSLFKEIKFQHIKQTSVRKKNLKHCFFSNFFQEFAETSLHYAISHETGHSLHIVDFIVQNSSSLDKQTREGNTPLHYCVIQNQCESMRLLLRSGANPGLENKNGKTPLSIAKERGHELCEELVIFFNKLLL